MNKFNKYSKILIFVLFLFVLFSLLFIEFKVSNFNLDQKNFLNASKNQDESVCYNIKDDLRRSSCSAQIKISKLKEQAIIEKNISKCYLFEDKNLILNCEDNYYFALSVNEENKDFCQNIKNMEFKNECYKIFN